MRCRFACMSHEWCWHSPLFLSLYSLMYLNISFWLKQVVKQQGQSEVCGEKIMAVGAGGAYGRGWLWHGCPWLLRQHQSPALGIPFWKWLETMPLIASAHAQTFVHLWVGWFFQSLPVKWMPPSWSVQNGKSSAAWPKRRKSWSFALRCWMLRWSMWESTCPAPTPNSAGSAVWRRRPRSHRPRPHLPPRRTLGPPRRTPEPQKRPAHPAPQKMMTTMTMTTMRKKIRLWVCKVQQPSPQVLLKDSHTPSPTPPPAPKLPRSSRQKPWLRPHRSQRWCPSLTPPQWQLQRRQHGRPSVPSTRWAQPRASASVGHVARCEDAVLSNSPPQTPLSHVNSY